MLLSHLFSTPFSAKSRVDVQMTRDRVPVIYHYFLVSESGAKIVPHNLSVDQVSQAGSVTAAFTQK